MNTTETRLRILFLSIAPPLNDCGVRVVLHRHLIERHPFDLHLVTTADFYLETPEGTKLKLPYLLQRLRKSRFGPLFSPWITDYENLLWTLSIPKKLDRVVREFRPDVILTLAETGLSQLAAKVARKHEIPLAGLFLDWFPIMKPHYGHEWTQRILSRRYRELYRQCDLAFCTSDGMREVLGEHLNAHVIYPMPGQHKIPEVSHPPDRGKFRLVYVGSALGFYGRMLCSLMTLMEERDDLELIVVGPTDDWPSDLLERSKKKGCALGFLAPNESAAVLTGADALLVVMSFEEQHRLFMETSFTTKFLDYSSFGKPILLWGPEYCTPVRVVRRDGGALIVGYPDPALVINACQQLMADPQFCDRLREQAKFLHEGLFNPERLQKIFVTELEKLVISYRSSDHLRTT